MIGTFGLGAHESIEFRVGHGRRSGRELGTAEGIERLLCP